MPLLPAPFTAQTLGGVILAGGILGGARRGFASMALFVLLVAIGGAPVLVGGVGGLGMILGPTGGFIIAYPPFGALVTGLLIERWWPKLNYLTAFLAGFIGGAGALRHRAAVADHRIGQGQPRRRLVELDCLPAR